MDQEGLNPLYKFSALALLAYADKYPSMKVQKTTSTLKQSINLFETLAYKAMSKTECLPFDELIVKRMLKRKHYYYGAYLAVVSSLPILSKVMDDKAIVDPIIAKTSEISSIKALDNLNDEYHGVERALKTMEIQRQAFLNRNFQLPKAETPLSKAENSIYALAALTCRILSSYVDFNSTMYKVFQADLDRYFKGQMDSMLQKVNGKAKVDIKEFLMNINEKGVGNVWIDVDFCFLEAFHILEEGEYRAMANIRKAIDLIFKGCNVYDDIADFKVDMAHNIWNSVVYLALDKGYCDEDDLIQPAGNLANTLERLGAFNEAMQLGDLIFLKGVEKLEEAKEYTKVIDVDALKFNAYLLRLFAIRKWLIEAKSPLRLLKILRPTVSDQILSYNRYIV
jgi:hypothetical protein